MNHIQDDKGLTIIELLVALFLLSLVMSSLMTAYWSGSRAFKRQTAGTDARYMARTAMQWLISDIREAAEFTIEGNRLLIQTPDNEGIWYRLDDSNQLLRNNVPVAENISDITYNTGFRLIEVTVVAVVNDEVYTLSGSVSPRRQN
jgi:prepilin-type N-terminal cleavage/methylation domain-containing protein